MNTHIKHILEQLADCINNNTYQTFETEIVEFKASLPNEKGREAESVYDSINAFLNTKGGFVIIGIKIFLSLIFAPQHIHKQIRQQNKPTKQNRNPIRAAMCRRLCDSIQQIFEQTRRLTYNIPAIPPQIPAQINAKPTQKGANDYKTPAQKGGISAGNNQMNV